MRRALGRRSAARSRASRSATSSSAASSSGHGSSWRSEEHTSELQSQSNLVCRLLLEKKKHKYEPHSQPHDVVGPRHDKRTIAKLHAALDERLGEKAEPARDERRAARIALDTLCSVDV